MSEQPRTLADVADALRAPFSDHKYRVGATWSNNRGGRSGKVLPYIDARHVMERLDSVVGPDNWSTIIRPTTQPGAFICELTVLGVTKSAVGQAGTDESEKEKSGESDALKRAAVYHGIGRYLYSVDLPPVDLTEKNGKWNLPHGWRPGESPSAGRSASGSGAPQRPVPDAAPQPSAPLVAGGIKIRPPSRNKLFASKVGALKGRARDVLGWDERKLTQAIQKWYGAPSLEDLESHEFMDLMDKKIAAAAAEIAAKSA